MSNGSNACRTAAHRWNTLVSLGVEACSICGCSPRSAAFPPHSPPSVSRLCSSDSLVLRHCPTPRRRTCGPYGPGPSPAVLWSAATAEASEVSRFSCMKCLGVSGVYDYAGLNRDSRLRLCPCCLPLDQQRRHPDLVFSKLDTQPTYSPVYASSYTSRCTTQNSGPSGSLLLPRKNFPFSASCRFIPAHWSPTLRTERRRAKDGASSILVILDPHFKQITTDGRADIPVNFSSAGAARSENRRFRATRRRPAKAQAASSAAAHRA